MHTLFISSSFLAFKVSSSLCFFFWKISYMSSTLNDFLEVVALNSFSFSLSFWAGNSSLNNLRRNEPIISSSFFILFSNFFVSSKLFFLFMPSCLSNLSCFFFTKFFDQDSLIPKTNTKNSLFIKLHSFSV